jgi:alcohol dehydrogenase YqhD (iron-dependent ADH family)
MNDFVYYAPTRVVFGKQSERRTGELVKKEGAKKALVHYSGSALASGLVDRVNESLAAAGVICVRLGGVVPNPRLSTVREGIALCKREGVDFIVAVGGGSAIDSAKAIGFGACYDGDVWDFYLRKEEPVDCLPLGAVLTIAAAGSEMSNSSVITNEDGWLKRSVTSDLSRCKFAIMNPELTFTLPQYQTQCGCTDIMMHTLERYLNRDPRAELRDGMSEALLRTVMRNAKILMNSPRDYAARAEIMWAGSLSHNDLLGDRETGDWATHQLSHELSAMFDAAHGAALAAVWASWARYVYQAAPKPFAQLAQNVLGILPGDAEKTALLGIEAMEAFFRSIGMPTSIRELGIDLTEAQIEEMAYKCSYEETRTIGKIKTLGCTEIGNIYRMAQ